MRDVIWLVPVIAMCLLFCGCTDQAGQEADMKLYDQTVQAVREFVEDQSYQPGTSAFSVESGVTTLSGQYETYSMDVDTSEIVFASYQGEEGIESAREGPHYKKTLIAVRQFLQNPDFEIHATSFTYKDDRYEISGNNVTFRVNATTGDITRALLTGPEAVGAMGNSSQYQMASAAFGMNQSG